MTENQQKNLRDRFAFAQSKKILLYGTGIVARNLAIALHDFQIAGCLDRYKVDGNIEGIPIITWDDIEEGMADILIIAATQKNCREIYDRIVYRCISLHLDVYGPDGLDLKEMYLFQPTSFDAALYYQKNAEDLKTEIRTHDAISFDLFDTLIMRKTLEPADVFDLVEDRLKEKGILIPQFKKKRQIAEQRTPGGNIYQIYDTFKTMYGLDKEVCEIALREEIQCEKDCVIPRTVMAEAFHYAITLGKKVSILTDMYLPTPIIEDILSSMGIEGYDKLYVSCDYGVGKGNGLFSIYLKTVSGLRCLHIGDNKQIDIEAAEQYGIDTYYIKSAYEMLKISNFRECLLYEKKQSDRVWIGLLISELFNDPFSLYQLSGVVRITDVEMFGKVFIAPIVVAYMQKLYTMLKSQKYDGVLFAARDGYFFKKIYDSGIMGKPPVPSIYFLTSRNLAIKSMMQCEKDILDLIEYLQEIPNASVGDILCDLFGQECIDRAKEENCVNMDVILSKSAETRRHYIVYMESVGIDLSKKYLLCDMFAQGTSQKALNKIMFRDQDAFYLCRMESRYRLSIESLYHKEKINGLIASNPLLEVILTAPVPSIYDMGENGTPIYAVEDRNQETLYASDAMQKGIKNLIDKYKNIYKTNEKISKDLAYTMLELRQFAVCEGSASIVNKLIFTNNIGGKAMQYIV